MKENGHPSRLGPLRRRVHVANVVFGQSMPKRDLQDSSDCGSTGTSSGITTRLNGPSQVGHVHDDPQKV